MTENVLINIDRLQFDGEKLLVFEFFNYERERSNLEFIKKKLSILSDKKYFDKFYLFQYTNDLSIVTEGIRNHGDRHLYTFDEFQKRFRKLNTLGGYLKKNSKQLGSATDNIGDPFIQKLLQTVYSDISKFDFSLDDSGLGIVERALEKDNTYGFDFDLYETEQHIVIEFLKRENKYISNLQAHPIRYEWNKQKFISLYKASKRVNGTLLLVNYSDDEQEDIGIIEVVDFNLIPQNTYSKIIRGYGIAEEQRTILSDIGYKFNGYQEFIEWLKILNSNSSLAMVKLKERKKERRDIEWWDEFYLSSEEKRTQMKRTIGKSYNL